MPRFPTDGPALPVAVQQELFRSKKASPVAFAQAALDRAAAYDALNFIRIPSADQVLAQARESEARWSRNEPMGPLDGIVATIKDNCLVKGWVTRWGSLVRSETASEDSPPVARMREAGAIFLGQTTLPEWGWKATTDSPLTGTTRNPHDPTKTSGGSSGGAAVAAAVGVSTINLGSDGAGSIRIPAAFCGVYGFKPTYGVVPAAMNALPSLTTYGPITRTVEDAELMFDVLQKYDGRDHLAHYCENLPIARSSSLRIAYSAVLGGRHSSPEVEAVLARAISRLRSAGYQIEEVGTVIDDPWPVIKPIYFSFLSVLVSKIDRSEQPKMDPNLVAGPDPTFDPTARDLVDAMMARNELSRRMTAFHADYDILLTPTVAVTPFEVGQDFPAGMSSWFDWAPFAFPFNLSQQPAATVPCGLSKKGLPVGLQIVGARYQDKTVLAFSKLCMSVFGPVS